MKLKANLFILFASVGLLLFQSCNKGNVPDPPQGKREILRIEEVLNGKDQNLIHLLNKVRGSVGTRGSGSKTIWSRKNDYGLGLYISANHVYNISSWSSRKAHFFDLTSENIGIFATSQIPPINGNIVLGDTLIADFPFMHFDISSSATNTSILPAEDFYLGIIDNQRTQQEQVVQSPELVKTAIPLQMYDPSNRTKANKTWNTPIAGEFAIAVGYPQDEVNYPNGAVIYGKILSDDEATDVIRQLRIAGDVEGDIPYQPGVEFFIEAQAIAGMSGGGVFNTKGQLLGIMVRASTTEKAPEIVRVVRLSYIRSKMVAFYHTLPETSRIKVKPFISGELAE